jgi:hypothetical protein
MYLQCITTLTNLDELIMSYDSNTIDDLYNEDQSIISYRIVQVDTMVHDKYGKIYYFFG